MHRIRRFHEKYNRRLREACASVKQDRAPGLHLLAYTMYIRLVDVCFLFRGQRFVWDVEKASANESKHGVRFETACAVFFDPFVRFVEASVTEERRDAALGFDETGSMLFVVHVWREEETLRIVSARAATVLERRLYEDGE